MVGKRAIQPKGKGWRSLSLSSTSRTAPAVRDVSSLEVSRLNDEPRYAEMFAERRSSAYSMRSGVSGFTDRTEVTDAFEGCRTPRCFAERHSEMRLPSSPECRSFPWAP